MTLLHSIRNSQILRWPLLATAKLLLQPLKTGPAILRRAAYDAMPVPYLVTGHVEYFVVSTADKVIGRELFLHGEFDFQKLQKALSILQQEGLQQPTHLIDVGANIGSITIPALKRGLMKTATAIEPHPDNLRLLRANIALNGLEEQVTVLAQAVGDRTDEMLLLNESGTNSGNHMIGRSGTPVRSTRLDDLYFPNGGCLLWMDIEGYEGHALEGAQKLLNTGLPFATEFNHSLLSRSNGFSLFHKAIGKRKIFDLGQAATDSTTIGSLLSRFEGTDNFTDILVLP